MSGPGYNTCVFITRLIKGQIPAQLLPNNGVFLGKFLCNPSDHWSVDDGIDIKILF